MKPSRSVFVRRAGLSTTIQDLGRFHTRHLGVALGGAMDRVSHELANRLVGNQPNAATLEMTLTGDELHWTFDAVIAIAGADMSPVARFSSIDATNATGDVDVPSHRPVFVPDGTSIQFRSAKRGCRCYLAVAGGFDVPEILGSRSTLMRATLGGLEGRKLQAGDVLPVGFPDVHGSVLASWTGGFDSRHFGLPFPSYFVRPIDLPSSRDYAECVIRVVSGTHSDHLTEESRRLLTESPFQISSASDRMGYRLAGEKLYLQRPLELQSEGTSIGTIQLPPDGQPIILMADSAPTGGYPRIAHVITADLPLVAQLRPGQCVRFQFVSLDEANKALYRQREVIDRALMMLALR
jgi:antagonist of KipI